MTRMIVGVQERAIALLTAATMHCDDEDRLQRVVPYLSGTLMNTGALYSGTTASVSPGHADACQYAEQIDLWVAIER